MQNKGLTQCSLQVIKQRAFLLAKIREFFANKNVLEVETPILSSAGNTDIHIESFCSQAIKSTLPKSYLRTSAEFPLKRLLCSGVGDVYEIGKVFRFDEMSKTHNTEFTMLEWYRLDFNYNELIQEVTDLFKCILLPNLDSKLITKFMTFNEVFKEFLGIDLNTITTKELNELSNKFDYSGSQLSKDEALDFLFATQIQPKFDKNTLTFIALYPASQAALAQINPNDKNTAFRFEVFYQGHELGNGYQELTDAQELRKRFEEDNKARQLANMDVINLDENLLNAMEQGMPACSGIAIGVDRLLMCLLKSTDINQVLTFSSDQA